MNNKELKKNLIIKIAEKIGKDSVGKCGVWFNQPVVPAKLNNKGKS